MAFAVRYLVPLLLFLSAGFATAFPSFRFHVPNGKRVPCPPGGQGCRQGNEAEGEPASVCYGLGHEQCAGGYFARNAFGLALKSAGFQWTQALCNADSDGDNYTNGEELGDPCCKWAAGAEPSQYMKTFVPSHPGLASHSPPADYVRPSCQDTLPAFQPAAMAKFAPGEEQRYVEFFIKNYTIPSVRTTYVDFVWNFDDESQDIFHIVYGTALVDQPKLLHHFVVNGCAKKISEDRVGKALRDGESEALECGIPVGGFSGWAPGGIMWENPTTTGVPVGKGVGVVAFHIQVHFTDGNLYPNSVSQDGMRIYYTPTLRNQTVVSNLVINLGRAPMWVPPGRPRFFFTRSCTVELSCAACELPVVGAFFHAHLLGTEMYQTLIRDRQMIDLGSQSVWHFDDQATFDLQSKNITLRNGDVIQSSCVWDSTMRAESTLISLETVDEMCLTLINTAQATDADPPVTFQCNGDLWEGDFAAGEDALLVATNHPTDQAQHRYRLDGEGNFEGQYPVSSACSGSFMGAFAALACSSIAWMFQ